ncbi:hypothetical protein BC941DRAFT_342879 [Chlamydoabsidia padenii]|nr:hypothetical protein BC941DRAFT_342879 [Chlamydoabsidia padenii]
MTCSNTDALAALLSLPVDFAIDPLVTLHSSSIPNFKPVIKKSRLSLEDKDQKTKERILRNRAAAQESRDKKRRYVADLETSNQQLRTENESMNKRIKLLETQNQTMSTQLSDFARQIAELQQQLLSSNSTSTSSSATSTSSLLAHGFCDSARIAKSLLCITSHYL